MQTLKSQLLKSNQHQKSNLHHLNLTLQLSRYFVQNIELINRTINNRLQTTNRLNQIILVTQYQMPYQCRIRETLIMELV